MANKLYAMELLTEEVAKDVAANPQEWMRFLNTASRLYRYTFPEQLLIYAQRPGATAVASMGDGISGIKDSPYTGRICSSQSFYLKCPLHTANRD